MTKREIVIQIRSAKYAHIRWKSFVQMALRGVLTDVKKTGFPIVQTECEFGQWYYGEGMFLLSLPNFQALEKPHATLHEIYIQIYTLQKAKLQGGFFSSKKSMLESRKGEINKLITSFNDYSKILLERIRQLEIEIIKMSHADVKGLYKMEMPLLGEKDDSIFFRQEE